MFLGREGKPSRFIKNEPLILDKCLVAEPELETKTEYDAEYKKAESQTAGGRVYPLTKVGLTSVVDRLFLSLSQLRCSSIS